MFWRSNMMRGGSAIAIAAILLGGCSGFLTGGGHSGSVPNPGASPQATTPGVVPGDQPTVEPSSPGTTTTDAAAYVCPTSDTATAVVRGGATSGEAVRRAVLHHTSRPDGAAGATQLLAVNYEAAVAATRRTALDARETALGLVRVRSYTFAHAGLVTHVLAVPARRLVQVEAVLRATPGVRAVGVTGSRRYPSSVNAPYFPNDPYFTGFATTVPPTTGGADPAATFKTGPVEESADVPGQWDMHVTQLEYAFGYSQPNNGSGVVSSASLGSAAVKLAVIDTGQDTTHPELKPKIAYQRCFITNPDGVQSTSNFTTDPAGHGTDVAGIAGAATGNGLGFTAAGGGVTLYGYRVFPTPDDSCASSTSADNQCGTDTQDIASAILDAVNAHVNVISLSLGGTGCSNGTDPDPTEGAAVAEAIAANIIVVAAAGNGSGPPVEAPACDPGVIAVGATGLADGQTNGSAKAGGTPIAPLEYVASYSDYGDPGATPGSSAAWGIVAPGGDPTANSDADNLHWIENLWTSTPFMADASDTSFSGNCVGDYPAQTGPADCRVLIAGTSMATPHVAGAAALIISANPAYQSPALMRKLLCATADDIGDADEGCGRLDVYRAMASALSDGSPPPPKTAP